MNRKLRGRLKIRKYPYPYKCALTICNDIDNCDLNTFLQIHYFLNSTEDTEYGKGLGLDMGDSFWLYSEFLNDMTYFKGLSKTRSRAGEVIADFIREGYIDCLHSYGNLFSKNWTRESWQKLVVQGLQSLKKEGLFVDTWINHGLDSNGGNLWARNHPNFCGDDPQSEVYHTDLMKSYGIRYVWLNELTDVLIHEVDFTLAPFVVAREIIFNVVKNFLKIMIGKRRKVRRTSSINSLVEPIVLGDGNKFISFKRFQIGAPGSWDGANREGLARQLTAPVLKELIAREGTAIIYTHLGKTEQPSNNPIFNQQTIESLGRLAKEFKSGEIFVTTTSRLLNYILRRNSLRWEEHISENGSINISVENVNDPIEGLHKATVKDLDGICFKTTCRANVKFWVSGIEVEPDFNHQPEGKYFCTGFDFPRLKFPEKYKDPYYKTKYLRTSNQKRIR